MIRRWKMEKDRKGVSRRQFIKGSAAVEFTGLMPRDVFSQAKEVPIGSRKSGTRLILLGTGGGPRPNKMRNQSSWVVLTDGVPYVVDCGGGVSRQMVFANISLAKLRHIFITHHHSDHNLEYGGLMYNAWVSGFKGRMDTYGPPPIEKISKLFLETNAYDINTRISDEGRPPLGPMIHPHEFSKGGLVVETENVKVTAALVNHPPVEPAFAYRFDAPDRSIVFSGDTTPCEGLVKLAQGADFLVHEVLHKPSLAKLLPRVPHRDKLLEHIIGSHTTHIDVGKVAKEAGVKTLVLTHFVPADDPSLTDEMWIEGAKTHFEGKVIVGKDLMEIS